jgi:hypothetical protein
MFKISENANKNYLAKIVALAGIRKHTNADRLQCVNIDGNNVITGLDAKEGALYVYFPLESALNKEYLSWSNSFEDKSLNAEKEKKGFFNKHGRIRAIKLRGERSEGYIVPVSDLCNWLSEKTGKNVSIGQSDVNTEFDYFEEIQICEKYVNREVLRQKALSEKRAQNKVAKQSKIVDGQFRFHVDTSHLSKNVQNISPNDIISLTNKLHGCVYEETEIETLEYGIMKIKEIVDKRISCHIKAFNTETSEVVYAKIDDYYFKENDGDWFEIELEDGIKITITGNNPVWLPDLNIYREVYDLKEGDFLLID